MWAILRGKWGKLLFEMSSLWSTNSELPLHQKYCCHNGIFRTFRTKSCIPWIPHLSVRGPRVAGHVSVSETFNKCRKRYHELTYPLHICHQSYHEQRWIFLVIPSHAWRDYFFYLVQIYSNEGVSCKNIQIWVFRAEILITYCSVLHSQCSVYLKK